MSLRRQASGFFVALLTLILGVSIVTLTTTRRPPPTPPAGARAPEAQTPEAPPATPAEARPPTYLQAIEIVNHDQEYALVETPSWFDDLSAGRISVDLELGESIQDQFIVLHLNPGYEAHEFNVEQRFETSMTLMDEGPHVDLTEWKHYRSGWEAIKKVAPNKFLTSEVGEEGHSKFPKVTREEIYKAVKKVTKNDRWLGLARQCASPNEYPCAVSVSKISFRIKVREGGEWRVIKVLDFLVPMGC